MVAPHCTRSGDMQVILTSLAVGEASRACGIFFFFASSTKARAADGHLAALGGLVWSRSSLAVALSVFNALA